MEVSRLDELLSRITKCPSRSLIREKQRTLSVDGSAGVPRSRSDGHVPLGGGADHDARGARFHLVTENRGRIDRGVDGGVDSRVDSGGGTVLCCGEGDVVEHQAIT